MGISSAKGAVFLPRAKEEEQERLLLFFPFPFFPLSFFALRAISAVGKVEIRREKGRQGDTLCPTFRRRRSSVYSAPREGEKEQEGIFVARKERSRRKKKREANWTLTSQERERKKRSIVVRGKKRGKGKTSE